MQQYVQPSSKQATTPCEISPTSPSGPEFRSKVVSQATNFLFRSNFLVLRLHADLPTVP